MWNFGKAGGGTDAGRLAAGFALHGAQGVENLLLGEPPPLYDRDSDAEFPCDVIWGWKVDYPGRPAIGKGAQSGAPVAHALPGSGTLTVYHGCWS